jgi:N-acetylmuramoyl-L-alanine amidase-like protein
MDNLNQRRSDFEIVPWPTRVAQSESRFGDLFGRIGSGISDVAGRLADAVRGAGIIDLTAKADKSVRKGTRDLTKVKALVLHQMACCFQRKDPLKAYLRLKAHFAILPDGRILQIHPIRELIWASNGFNNCSVAVEFAGNFPNTKGKWWEGDKFGRNKLTAAQIEAGRRLIRYLVGTIGLRTILAHRQSSATRENDPGPDIWYNIGQWAVDTLGLKDGGRDFKVGDGNSIPDLWRIWGRTRPATPAREAEFTEFDESDQEVAFGPLNVRLTWLPGTYSYSDVRKIGHAGGVYIAFDKLPNGKIKILKVGMADTFARRMGDKLYLAWTKKYPHLRFYLATVVGVRSGSGIGGVVRMVEFALVRLLRRAGELTDKQLPWVPSPTLGAVTIENVLPKGLKHLLQPALSLVSSTAGGGSKVPGTPTPGQLKLPVHPPGKPPFYWEAESVARV